MYLSLSHTHTHTFKDNFENLINVLQEVWNHQNVNYFITKIESMLKGKKHYVKRSYGLILKSACVTMRKFL